MLVATACILDAAGLRQKHPGLAQVAAPDQVRRIAEVIGCDREALASRAGLRHHGGKGERTADVSFGPLMMPNRFLELHRRRIAPISLTRSGHHRLSWLNLLLPYCPESLERMVDACPACGTVLGWRIAAGLGVCEGCGARIPPSAEPALPERLSDDYRLLAGLSTPDAEAVERTLAELPATLRPAGPGTLVRLALHLGGLRQQPMIATSSGQLVVDLPAPTLAQVAAAGGAMLRRWPVAVADWVDETVQGLAGDEEALDAFKTRLRRMAAGRNESRELVALVTAALPHLSRRSGHTSSNAPRRLYRDVKRLLGLTSPQAAMFHDWPDLKVSTLPGRQRQHRLYDAEQLDALQPVFRHSIDLNAYSNRSGLPVYAVERLCFAGLLEWEDHPAVLLTKPWICVRLASTSDFERRLDAAARPGEPPQGAISLSRAAARIGGREKPWAAICASLAYGALPFWRTSLKSRPTRLQVLPDDLAAFDRTFDVAGPPAGFARAERFSQLDAAELLNLQAVAVDQHADRLGLRFAEQGRALTTPKQDVLSVAGRIAFASEIAPHLRLHARAVPKRLAQMGTTPEGLGWSRASLIGAGVLPALP